MSASESHNEPTLFDQIPAQAPVSHAESESGRSPKSKAKAKAKSQPAQELAETAGPAEDADEPDEGEGEGNQPDADPALSDRKRLEQQLIALKRKEAEVRCALVATTHPELADRVREIQGKAYAVSKAEEKLAQGLPKSEARRQEKLDKKLSTLRTKRAELEAQIEAAEQEIAELGTGLATFESERAQAMQALMAALGAHGEALEAAQVQPQELVADLERWWPELEAIAREVSAEQSSASE